MYGRELSAEEIAARAHREAVGGMWDEIGALQLDFLRAQGLAAPHRLLDVGCGALRGGVHFVRFLDPGGYHGLDVNPSLIAAGERELVDAGLADRGAHLIVDDRFAVSRFGQRFEFALAVSLFTHLAMNSIVRCMVEVAKVLAPSGRFFASWFEAPKLSSTRTPVAFSKDCPISRTASVRLAAALTVRPSAKTPRAEMASASTRNAAGRPGRARIA